MSWIDFVFIAFGIAMAVTVLTVISAVELNRRRSYIMFYHRNFYTHSENDMRELEIIKSYCDRRNLRLEIREMTHLSIIMVDIPLIFKTDIDYLTMYGFTKREDV